MEQLRLLSFQSKVITYSMRPPHSIVAPSARVWGKIGKTQQVLRRTSLESGGRLFYLSTDKSIRLEMEPPPPLFFFFLKSALYKNEKGARGKRDKYESVHSGSSIAFYHIPLFSSP